MNQVSPSGSVVQIWTDGGSRGNPGPSAFGVVIKDQHGHVVKELSSYLGEKTNNVAEYHGLLAGLQYCLEHRVSHARFFCDSELMVKQVQGVYKVRHPEILTLFTQAKQLSQQIDHFEITHIRREGNREADRIVNRTLNEAAHHAFRGTNGTDSQLPAPAQENDLRTALQNLITSAQLVVANWEQGDLAGAIRELGAEADSAALVLVRKDAARHAANFLTTGKR